MIKRPLARSAFLASAVLAVGVLQPQLAGAAANDSADDASVVRACDLPDAGSMPRAASNAGPEDLNPGTEWLLGDEAQAALIGVYDDLKESGRDKALLGSFIHWDQRRVVFVTDPDVAPEVARDAREKVHSRPGAPVSVARGCASGAALAAALNFVRDDPSFKDVGVTTLNIDPAAGKVHVGADDPSTAQAIADRRHKGLVRAVKEARAREKAGSRTGDYSPHWGGARIEGRCSTSVPVRIDHNGARRVMMLSAGHCAQSGITFWNSGTHYYGSTQHVRYSTSAYGDMMLLGATGDPYTSTFHTGPSSPTSRRFVGYKDLSPGIGACVSGSFTGAKCGAVTERNTIAQDTAGVRTYVAIIYKAGDSIIEGGDSGGPAYGRLDSTTADFRGLLTSAPCATNQCDRAAVQNPSEVFFVYGSLNPQFAF